MSCTFGEKIKITFFGQSHSDAIGVVIDGLSAGEEIDLDEINTFLSRRAGGREFTTKRHEDDRFTVLSGLYNGKTCGAPLCAVTDNNNASFSEYKTPEIPRPSHADYPAWIKHEQNNDTRGGGNFSGRMTSPLCFAGGVAKQILMRHGIFVGAHIYSVGNINDASVSSVLPDLDALKQAAQRPISTVDEHAGEKMLVEILSAKDSGNSLGGVIECFITGLPVGLGDGIFNRLDSQISSLLFALPGVKGVEFGSGFDGTLLTGLQNNDPYYFDDQGNVKTRTNNHGGILGGLSSGMPVVVRAAIKPTPSISLAQQSVDLIKNTPAKIEVTGRHDPCIVPRCVPCVEAACALAVLERM